MTFPAKGFGPLCLRKDFWNRHGTNIATCLEEIFGERLFDVQIKDFGERSTLFAVVLS